MNRSVVRAVVLVLVVSAASLAVGTSASVLSGPADPVSEEVVLSPAPGANGDYAYLVNGELVVDLTSANPNVDGDGLGSDSVTTLDDVFEIHYRGDRFARVWLTHDSDAVTLRADGHPIQSETNTVVLESNQSKSVGLRVDTTGSVDGLLEDMTVHARVAAPEDVAGTTRTTSETDDTGSKRSIRSFAPDDATRTFTVTNAPVGEPVTLDTDRLLVDDAEAGALTLDSLSVSSDTGSTSVNVQTIEDTEGVDVGPGVAPLGALAVEDDGTVTAATFRFSAAPAYLDEYDTTLDRLVVRRNDGTGWHSLDTDPVGMRKGRTVFTASSSGFSTFVVGVRTPALRVTDAELDRPAAAPGESVPVMVSVTNDGLATGERRLSLSTDGTQVATRTVELDPGESTTVQLDAAMDSSGEYAVTVDGVDAGTLVVAADPSTATAAHVDTATDAPIASPRNAARDDATTPTASLLGQLSKVGAFGLSSTLGLLGSLLAVFVALTVRRYRDA